MLDVARQIFCARGYERTPLRSIADALGVTKAAVYHHFKAKDDLLAAIVGPVLDRIDSVVEGAGPGPLLPAGRRAWLGRYVEELCSQADIATLLLHDPAVAEHAVGRRFAGQRARMRVQLGEEDDPASRIRTSTALRALELAIVDFASAYPAQVRETAVNVAMAVLDSGPPTDPLA
jgi:AcrR family transcriptional regulator